MRSSGNRKFPDLDLHQPGNEWCDATAALRYSPPPVSPFKSDAFNQPSIPPSARPVSSSPSSPSTESAGELCSVSTSSSRNSPPHPTLTPVFVSPRLSAPRALPPPRRRPAMAIPRLRPPRGSRCLCADYLRLHRHVPVRRRPLFYLDVRDLPNKHPRERDRVRFLLLFRGCHHIHHAISVGF